MGSLDDGLRDGAASLGLIRPALKPAAICRAAMPRGGGPDDLEWARLERARLEAEVSSLDLSGRGLGAALRLRNAGPGDFAKLEALYDRCFAGTFPASSYQLIWALRCGRGAVVEAQAGELVGVHLETPAADLDHSSYSIGACVDARARGFRLSGVLARYTALRAFMGGARVRRGIVSPKNVGSCAVLLHEVGANFVKLHEPFVDFGAPRFEYALELSRAALSSQRVDAGALAAWLDSSPPGVELVPIHDYGAIAALLDDQRHHHHLVAMCRERAAYVSVRRGPALHISSERRL